MVMVSNTTLATELFSVPEVGINSVAKISFI